MAQGTIKTLKEDKGFGFITPNDDADAKDLFFHANSLEGIEFDSLKEGDEVTFDTEDGERGPAAVNVQLA